MESTELRYGNYIECYGVIHKLWYLDGDTIVIGDDETPTCTVEDAKPIPLTQVWLRKFGFEGRNDTFSKNGFEMFGIEAVSYHPCYDWTGVKVGMRCLEYVHQLQNLFFAITGEELELKD